MKEFEDVINHLLPKVKEETGYMKHIISHTRKQKRTFVKLFWDPKIRPILEYGSELWGDMIPAKFLKEIDKVQCNFFRTTLKYSPQVQQ